MHSSIRLSRYTLRAVMIGLYRMSSQSCHAPNTSAASSSGLSACTLGSSGLSNAPNSNLYPSRIRCASPVPAPRAWR